MSKQKIGALTFHNVTNYGGVLQCYALQNHLRELGYDTEVIDYQNSLFRKYYSPFFVEKRNIKVSSNNSFDVLISYNTEGCNKCFNIKYVA